MKLRLLSDSLRLRLSRPEMEDLLAHGTVTEETHLGDAVFRYQLSITTDAHSGPRCMLTGQTLTVEIAREQAESWARSNLIGLYGAQPFAQGTLEISIEKDFRCLAPRPGEENYPGFEHPSR